MATKAALYKRARELGVLIEHEPKDGFGMRAVEALAPNGKRFASDETHAIVASAFSGDPIGDAYADLIERMREGLIDCDPDTCESDCWNDDGTLSDAKWHTTATNLK